MNAENGETVGFLVGGYQQAAIRGDAEVTRPAPQAGLVLQELKLTGLKVDLVDGNTVLFAVGCVQEIAVGVNMQVGCVAGAGIISREGGNGLDALE